MKEVTKWNGKPRWMWVWDDNENNKTKKYVVSILSEKETREANIYCPVMVVGYYYKHCAEIEEESTRLTLYELSQLLKCFGVDCTWGTKRRIFNNVDPSAEEESKELLEDYNYKIRYKGGEWEEPTRETVFKWWCRESPDSDIARFVSFIGWDIDKE